MFALQYDENGTWLDSPVLVESVGTQADGPVYEDDVSAYQELYASLEGLCEYRATLATLKGINQHYALEAYELIPNWEQACPKAYYSQHLSQVQYTYTQENLLKSFWATLKRLWAYLKLAIKKAFYRLLGKTLPQDEAGIDEILKEPITPAQAQEAETRAQAIQMGIRKKKAPRDAFAHTVKMMQQVIQGQGFTMLMGEERKEYHSLNQLLDDLFSQPGTPEIYRTFYFTTDPLWRDMVTDGPYTQYLIQVAQQLPAIVASITSQLHFFEQTLSNIHGPDQDTILPVLTKLAGGSRQVPVDGSTPQSLASIHERLQALRRDWIVQTHTQGEERPDYTLFSQKTHYYWSTHALEELLTGMIHTTPDLAKLSAGTEKVGALFDQAQSLFDESEIGQAIRQATEYITKEASAAAAILLEMNTYLLRHRVMTDHSHALVTYFVNKIHPFLTQYGNDHGISEVVKSLTTIISELKD